MICPRCSVAEISPTTNMCELCGYVPSGTVAVDAPHPDATDELARAQLAHQFRIDVLLGQGVASAVYLAREQDSNRHILLKVLPRVPGRPEMDARFRDAIAAAAALDHPHLVPVLRHGETDSLLWYSMEHRRARPLRDVLRTGGKLDARGCMRLVTQIAAALDYLHRRGATHGHLKPENVLVDSEQWVYVCDAIVARAVHPPVLGEKSESATVRAYTAPEEELGGFFGPGTDQYALAVMIHECLTGTLPARDANGPTGPAIGSLRPDLPVHIGYAVARALSNRPNDRYPGILDFVTALESGTSLMVDARPSGRASDMILTDSAWEAPPRERPFWLTPLLAVVALAVLITSGVLLVQYRRARLDPWRDNPTRTITNPPPPSGPTVPAGTTTTALPAPNVPLGPRIGGEPLTSPGVVDLRLPRQNGRTRGNNPRPSSSETPSPSPAPAPPASAAAPAPAPAAAPAGENGRLFVNSSPWGQVFVDGQAVGNTPKANLSVTPGPHTIRVARDGFDPIERTIRVGAGETVRLTDLVLTPHP